MSYTAEEIAAVKAKAQEIAARGVTFVTVGDRTHRFEDVLKLLEFAKQMEISNNEDEHGGLLDVVFMEPS